MHNAKSKGSRSREAFKGEVQRWATKIEARPAQIRIQRMTRKWASVSTSGRVCFSTELLTQPRRFREYVIVHELLHLKVPNHGKLFKSLLRAYLPDTPHRHPRDTRRICDCAS
jgi:predicted metal-dependent hydrolase